MKLTLRSSSRALARKSVSVIAAKCDVTTALLRQLPIVFVVRAIFFIFKFNIASAIRHFHYNIPAIRPL